MANDLQDDLAELEAALDLGSSVDDDDDDELTDEPAGDEEQDDPPADSDDDPVSDLKRDVAELKKLVAPSPSPAPAKVADDDDEAIDLLDPTAGKKVAQVAARAVISELDAREQTKQVEADFIARFQKLEPDAPDEYIQSIREQLRGVPADKLLAAAKDPAFMEHALKQGRTEYRGKVALGEIKPKKAPAEPDPDARVASGGTRAKSAGAASASDGDLDGAKRFAQQLGLSDEDVPLFAAIGGKKK